MLNLVEVKKKVNKKTPTSRNRTSDLRITTELYSPPLYQLSYGRGYHITLSFLKMINLSSVVALLTQILANDEINSRINQWNRASNLALRLASAT